MVGFSRLAFFWAQCVASMGGIRSIDQMDWPR